MRVAIIIALLILAACSAPEAPPEQPVEEPEIEPVPPEPEVEPEDEPVTEAEDEAEIFESGLQKVYEQKDTTAIITEIRCDPELRKITFSFQNPTTVSWELDQNVGWPGPPGVAKVALLLNSIEMNGRPREPMFNEEVRLAPR